jgi:hypothetical protein
MKKVLDQTRNLIKTCGVSCYRIALDTGISKTRLSKLMNHVNGLSIESLEQLVDYLDHEIVIQPKRKKGK